jgi:putative ABC transport system permease protein
VTNSATGEQATSLTPIVIDASVYPFYGEVLTVDGLPLADAIQEPTDIVLEDNVARMVGVGVGDTVLVNGADVNFTVRGMVVADSEVKDPASDALNALFGFYYLDHSAMPYFEGVAVGADRIYLRLAEGLDVLEVNAALQAAFPFFITKTTEDLRENYTELADNIDQLVSVMGLVSLLIGSIGIINTMQVIVRRRTVEIAVLKTLGLQANQITILFMVEAVIMGVVGSLAGIVLGWVTTFAIRGVAEVLLAADLPFVLAPGPALNGLVVGTLVTAVFGFLPTLTAGQVRPATVLRPADNIIPRAGRWRTLVALVVIIVALSLVADSILGNLSVAFQVTVGAVIAAGILYVLLSFLIWLIGRFLPSLGFIDLKISLRQMLAGRTRAAVTLLALVVGVFSLSLITLMAESIGNLMEYALGEGTGGNVIITVAARPQLEQVERVLAEVEGVRSFHVRESYSLELLSMQEADGTEVSLEELSARLQVLNESLVGPGGRSVVVGEDFQFNWLEVLQTELGSISVRTPEEVAAEDYVLVAGRQLSAEDVGEPFLVITDSRQVQAAGIGVGDRLTFALQGGGVLPGLGGGNRGETVTFEIVGVVRRPPVTVNLGSGSGNPTYVLTGAFPEGWLPNNISVVADVDEEQMPILRRELGSIPGVFALETAVLNRLLTSLVGTFTAFPSMVAALGLIVGGVVIANSVALTTMERRREIAIMKAVGLQRERVLGMLLLENGILGLVGGLIGVGIGLAVLTLMVAAMSAPGSTLPVGTALLLMLLCVLVALVAAITTAWGASAEKPLNVLRYD